MKKLIATINMTLDGFCDQTALMSDDQPIISGKGLLLFKEVNDKIDLHLLRTKRLALAQ
jgi:hypothetical protein